MKKYAPICDVINARINERETNVEALAEQTGISLPKLWLALGNEEMLLGDDLLKLMDALELTKDDFKVKV